MSADNWTWCPRCVDRVRAEQEKAVRDVAAMYGTVPAAEYHRACSSVITPDVAVRMMALTFHEDYEFYGVKDGTITADYGGECSVCGLTVRLKHGVTFYPEPTVSER